MRWHSARRALLWLAFALGLMPGLCQAAELRAIGVSLTDMGNPFFTQIARGVESAARRLGGPNVKIYASSCAYDVQRQIEQLNRFIERKVDLIVLTAADPRRFGRSSHGPGPPASSSSRSMSWRAASMRP